MAALGQSRLGALGRRSAARLHGRCSGKGQRRPIAQSQETRPDLPPWSCSNRVVLLDCEGTACGTKIRCFSTARPPSPRGNRSGDGHPVDAARMQPAAGGSALWRVAKVCMHDCTQSLSLTVCGGVHLPEPPQVHSPRRREGQVQPSLQGRRGPAGALRPCPSSRAHARPAGSRWHRQTRRPLRVRQASVDASALPI